MEGRILGEHYWRETFEPVTLGHIRSHGVYCGSPIICPDETVIRPTEERNSQPS
jgi:hypothetical protein